MAFQVSVIISMHIAADDVNRAENIALDLIDRHLEQMLDCDAVLETSYELSADNPRSEG